MLQKLCRRFVVNRRNCQKVLEGECLVYFDRAEEREGTDECDVMFLPYNILHASKLGQMRNN
jgi:hypothetical protein